ncbi:hypothetical protein EDS67_00725 [candidate division KSB1 bacterium]|nr:MAG: hypothetical protein EDS67_00725 [candidate division KSB1 bacterium]MBC6946631.1 hypothetical protein [candidate division KSB1 bacterium]MCE7940104.1 hypothetical protein [Chlorobi bacterium CHB1]MDL1873597.1 hypothetical protein [Cytophagia bacterium CHB2]
MKCFTLFLMLALLVMVGCSNESPFEAQPQNGSLENAASLEKKGKKQVSIKGSFETTFQFIPLVCVDGSGTPVDCGTAGAIPVVVSTPFEGVGRLSQLGKSTVSSEQTVDFTKTPPELTGTDVFTMSKRDKLYATHSGISGAPDAQGNVTFSGEYVFTGGTGKFKGASGSAEFTGTASLATNKGEFSLRGKIKLKKHDRDDDDD